MAFTSRWPFSFDYGYGPDELFRSLLGAASTRNAGVFPPLNVYDDGNTFLVRAEIPGVNKDTLEITARGDELTLRGEREIQPAQKDASYHRRECQGGQFRRTLTLPQAVDADAVKATYKNGVLEVQLPRVRELQPRRIAVN
jgi:HSP20 family protein